MVVKLGVLLLYLNFDWIAKTSILLILGSLRNEVSIERDIVRKKILVCFLFCGGLIGNMYHVRPTEFLILPQKYTQNLTLIEIIKKIQNFFNARNKN